MLSQNDSQGKIFCHKIAAWERVCQEGCGIAELLSDFCVVIFCSLRPRQMKGGNFPLYFPH